MKKKISIIQMNVLLGEPDANFKHCLSLMEKSLADKPDILVLPETLNVGFFPKENLKELADDNGTRTKAMFGNFAAQHQINIVAGSVANKKHDAVYNTTYVFNRLGLIVSEYDKIHGFSPAGEHLYFQSGHEVNNFMLDEIKCSSIICYDMRFPELIRTATLKDVDLMFIPAQWPLVRKHHWLTLATARAIENQMFVCAVNGCGMADTTKYGGNSVLLNPWGEELCHLGTEEDIQAAEIDMDIIQNIRASINVFRDRRPDTYKL